MRCTTIYTLMNMCQYALGCGTPMVSHHVQFIPIRGIVLVLSDSSKQHTLEVLQRRDSYRTEVSTATFATALFVVLVVCS